MIFFLNTRVEDIESGHNSDVVLSCTDFGWSSAVLWPGVSVIQFVKYVTVTAVTLTYVYAN